MKALLFQKVDEVSHGQKDCDDSAYSTSLNISLLLEFSSDINCFSEIDHEKRTVCIVLFSLSENSIQ